MSHAPVTKYLSSGPTERKSGDCSGICFNARCRTRPRSGDRREWHYAVRRTIQSSTDNAWVVNAAMACWSASERGVIHTAVEDQAIGWQAPTTRMIGNDGKWKFANGVPPTCDRREHWDEDPDDEDVVADLTDGAAGVTTRTRPSRTLLVRGQYGRRRATLRTTHTETELAARTTRPSRPVQETTCDFLPEQPEQPEQPGKTGIIRQKTDESSG